jgi:hypothetical protein
MKNLNQVKTLAIALAIFLTIAALTPPTFAQTNANKCVSGDCVNGKGKMVYSNGNIYEGDFVSGIPEGYGTTNFANGSIYTGQFSNGKTDGQGVFKVKDGGIYSGQFSKNLFHGKGKYTFPDGGIYDGNWVNGIREGQGKMTFADGGIYDGSWVNGKREGQGTYTTKDGSYYSGEWKKNKAHGYGKDYNKANNIKREGTYKDGNFVPATPIVNSTSASPNSNDSEETRVNGLKEYYKQALQKLGISVVKDGTAVNTSTSYRQLTVEASLEVGYIYHFIAICPEKVFVSGDVDEYQEYFKSGSFAKSSVPQKYGLTSYFYTAAYQGRNSSGSFTFKPTRQKVYWILFRSKRNSTESKDEISQATSELANDEDLKRIHDIEGKERVNYAVSGMTPEQRRKGAEMLTKMNADEKKVNETANALIPVMKRKQELEQSFSALYDKLQSDTKNPVTYAVQMKKDAEEIVRICEQFLSKYGTELGKTDLPSLNAKVDVINQQIREMRNDIVENKKNIELLEKIIKGNN